MYITLDILQQRGACQEYLDFFQKHYPDGVEMLHMIEHGHMPYHALHWGYQFLDPNEQEVAAYWKRVAVVDSVGVHESDHVSLSSVVRDSSQIESSSVVYHSKIIKNSTNIHRSEMIYDSNYISESMFVDGCEKVIKTSNATNSKNLYSSNYILDSQSVFESTNIVNSSVIWKSENMTNCYFCFGCHNLQNSLFCEGISDGEYMVFNMPIDKARFDMLLKQFKKFEVSLKLTEDWPSDKPLVPKIFYDYRKHFEGVPEQFWKWVSTLPKYNPQIMYSLTFDSRFLF